MQTNPIPVLLTDAASKFHLPETKEHCGLAAQGERDELREAFDSFVGHTFFAQLLAAMRRTGGKPAYFHGGRAEDVFRGQLDQVLAENMTTHSANQWTGPMFELFMLPRT